MKVIVDNKIPFIREALEQIADEVVYVPGKEFTPQLVKDADALIIRTRTRCDRHLLEGSRVQFIATATIGFDHIDADYCRQAGIMWTNAPGCNSVSVAQYIQAALLLLQRDKHYCLTGKTLGVIGVGNVGSKIVEVGQRMGMNVLLNDLPRADREGESHFCSLQTLAQLCDIISFHVPLYREGRYKTFHLADADFFESLQRKPVIMNTSRGEVIETEALLQALNRGKVSEAVIDVWEHEPDINLDLLQRTFIGTPHIAGYSADGKATATQTALDALCRFFHLEAHHQIVPPMPEHTCIDTSDVTEAALTMYNPRRDDQALRAHPEWFEQLRGDYPLRRERKAYLLPHIQTELF